MNSTTHPAIKAVTCGQTTSRLRPSDRVLATARYTCWANTIPTVRTLGSSSAAALASQSPAGVSWVSVYSIRIWPNWVSTGFDRHGRGLLFG
ncbi:MAG TPA: hypothetical protein VFY84_03375 [Jiangellales bacterium]|nr:hypothetical protein [Jiangellales bacterium]